MKIKSYICLIISLIFSHPLLFAENNEYRLEVKDFTELKLNDHVNVEYRCSDDSTGVVLFKCSPEISHQLLFTSNKSCLTIQVADDFDYAREVPTIQVFSSMLEKVENGSDSTIRVLSNRPVKNFKAKVIGNGTIIVSNIEATSVDLSLMTGHGHVICSSGQAFKAKLSNVGTGTIQAGPLKVSQIKAILSGTGNIDCCATESLSIYGMGSGCVYYSGNPEKITNRSIGVKAYPVKE